MHHITGLLHNCPGLSWTSVIQLHRVKRQHRLYLESHSQVLQPPSHPQVMVKFLIDERNVSQTYCHQPVYPVTLGYNEVRSLACTAEIECLDLLLAQRHYSYKEK